MVLGQALRYITSFISFALIKVLCHIFYRGEEKWLSDAQKSELKDVKLMVLLNHTSLFEPVFIRFASWRYVWLLARRLIVPGADVTMQRPLTGKLLKLILPGAIPITRKKDDSWSQFLDRVNDDTVAAILPEGRMKRANGLDKFGRTMRVRGGVADILQNIEHGKILFVYSGGLHHIQKPGVNRFPKVFKTIRVNLELVEIEEYKAYIENLMEEDRSGDFTRQVMSDMNERLINKIPQAN
ncbi:hypothetical protein EYS14_06245 [Alteromonadaceae bacterium M269]|nr:hypothetical protein EYS14_06245 [Alteromonadaceae bacterium M269]